MAANGHANGLPHLPQQPDATQFTYRYLDTFATEQLYAIKERIDEVVQDRREHQINLFGAAMPMPPTVKPEGAAAPSSEPINADLAQVLSPSQLEVWRDCQARWYFKYVVQLEELSDGRRALGRAVHKAFEAYFKTWIAEKQRLDLGALNALARAALKEELQGPVVLTDGDTAESLEADAVSYTALYLPQATTIDAARCEVKVDGKIGGVPVRGRIDVLDASGRVVDLKTSSKKPSGGPRSGYLVQLATYSMLVPGCFGSARIDTIVKKKNPEVHTQEVEISDAHRAMAEKLYPLAQEGMRTGLYYPNRDSFFCSKRSCSFWASCQKEYGGEVSA